MKNHRFLLVSILLIGTLGSDSDLFAQDNGKSAIEKLQEYNWRRIYTDFAEAIFEFTSEKDLKITAIVQTDKKNIFTEIMHYYLSDTIDKEFDDSKVGKNQDGSYLIYKSQKDSVPVTIRIVEITPTELKYENIIFKMLASMYPIDK